MATDENGREWAWFYAEAEDADGYHSARDRDDAIAKGIKMFGGQSFWICEGRRALLHDDNLFDADGVLEAFEERNEEAWGEDGPDATVTREMKRELEVMLESAFSAWRAKHKPYSAWALDETRHAETINPEPTHA